MVANILALLPINTNFMANKNTRRLRQSIRQAGKAGNASVVNRKPVFNYHSHTGSFDTAFVNQTFPTAVMGKDGIVSANERRNTCQRVYHNSTQQGSASLTCHEALNPDGPMVFKAHGYIEYRRPNSGPTKPAISA
jgi:hypothetical protein